MTDALMERATTVELGYVVDEQGLVFTRDVNAAEWASIGGALMRRGSATMWAIGDWLLLGGRDPKVFTQKGLSIYDRASAITGRSVRWLTVVANVALTFPRGQREPRLSWSHHCRIRNLVDSERQRLIARAVAERMTVEDLEVAVTTTISQAAAAGIPESRLRRRTSGASKTKRATLVECPHCHHQFEARTHRVAPAGART